MATDGELRRLKLCRWTLSETLGLRFAGSGRHESNLNRHPGTVSHRTELKRVTAATWSRTLHRFTFLKGAAESGISGRLGMAFLVTPLLS
ncbi:hypothetical protein GN956_G2723 [Arapaima gigas]